jgi:AcrR family transcriptional regulator
MILAMRSDSEPSGRTFVEEARRAQLVQTAIDVLATEGYDGASLAAIARAAGVSKGVISYHFDGKDDLLREVVGQVSAQAETAMTPQLLAAPTASARLAAYIRSNLAFMAEHPAALRALIEVIVHTPPPNPYAEQHRAATAYLETLVEAGLRSGEFAGIDPTAMALAIRGAIDAVPCRLQADPDLDVERLADHLTALFQRAVTAP